VQGNKRTIICYYSWSPAIGLSNPNIPDPIARPDTTTTYVVRGKDSSGCIATDSVTVTINNGFPLSITYSGQPISCDNGSVQLFVSGADKYQWSPTYFCDDPHSSQPFVSPDSTTKFFVTGYYSNGSCNSIDSVTILVLRDTAYMPNAFTPNGDGLNDVIAPKIFCDFHFDGFYIFNRWGNELFYTNVYKMPWDGTYLGVMQPQGVYVYFIQGHRSDGTPLIEKGNITLIR